MKSLSGGAKKAFINYFSGIDVQILLSFFDVDRPPKLVFWQKVTYVRCSVPETKRHQFIHEGGSSNWGVAVQYRGAPTYVAPLYVELKFSWRFYMHNSTWAEIYFYQCLNNLFVAMWLLIWFFLSFQVRIFWLLKFEKSRTRWLNCVWKHDIGSIAKSYGP